VRTLSTLVRWWLPLVAAWSVSRAWVVWLLLDRHAWVTGDVDYYAAALAAAPRTGLELTLVEYPLPGLGVVALPWLLLVWSGSTALYAELVMVLSLVADAAFTLVLVVNRTPGRRGAVGVWLLAVPCLGATVLARFDLVPGLLAAFGLLLFARRPAVAGAFAAFGAGVKLWPAVLLPVLAAPRGGRSRVLLAGAATGAALAVAGLAVAGADRLLSPLAWQAARGLQIESVSATPLMLARALVPARYAVVYSEHHAFEVEGPGTGVALVLGGVASWLALVALVVLLVRMWRCGHSLAVPAVTWASLSAVSVLIVTGKVLSPQYLLWLLPLCAVAVALAPGRPVRTWAVALLVAAAATQVVFPERYADLTATEPTHAWGVVALAARNGLLVWLAARAYQLAWREVSVATRSNASRPVRRGGSAAPSGGAPTTPA
jgi:hypothetical protein